MVSKVESNYFGNVRRLMDHGMSPEEAMRLCAEMDKKTGSSFMWEYYPYDQTYTYSWPADNSTRKKAANLKTKKKYVPKSKRWMSIEIG